MILLAPHITAFLQQRLPIERRASPNTCDSYAHAFRLLFEYASDCIKVPPSQLHLEQLDAPLSCVRGGWPALRPVGQQPAKEKPKSENRIAVRAGVHDLLLDETGDLPFNSFRDRDVNGFPLGLLQSYNLFAVRTLGHAGILSHIRGLGTEGNQAVGAK